MKKKDVIDLIRYHAEGNDNGFREHAYQIANEFDEAGDYQLAEYIMALMSNANVLVPQRYEKELHFLEKISIDNIPLFLPEEIANEILSLMNAINRKAEVNKFLFIGEPGTGKTEAVKHISRLLERDLYSVSFSTVIDSKLGQTQKNIEMLFDEINTFPYLDKAIILFDEIDALALDRINNHDLREMGRATSTLIKEFDKIAARAIVFATTNLYKAIDKALLRRFDYTVSFNNYTRDDLEDVAERILDYYLAKENNLERNKRLFKKILNNCEELPYPGDLKNIIKTAVLFSNIDDKTDYFKRLYNSFIGKIPDDINELKKHNYTIREIETLTGIPKSSVARELKEG